VDDFLRFAYSWGHQQKNCAFLGKTGDILKPKTKKLKDKQTSIATVEDLLRTFATFPTTSFLITDYL
jgi:hypothetical protein